MERGWEKCFLCKKPLEGQPHRSMTKRAREKIKECSVARNLSIHNLSRFRGGSSLSIHNNCYRRFTDTRCRWIPVETKRAATNPNATNSLETVTPVKTTTEKTQEKQNASSPNSLENHALNVNRPTTSDKQEEEANDGSREDVSPQDTSAAESVEESMDYDDKMPCFDEHVPEIIIKNGIAHDSPSSEINGLRKDVESENIEVIPSCSNATTTEDTENHPKPLIDSPRNNATKLRITRSQSLSNFPYDKQCLFCGKDASIESSSGQKGDRNDVSIIKQNNAKFLKQIREHFGNDPDPRKRQIYLRVINENDLSSKFARYHEVCKLKNCSKPLNDPSNQHYRRQRNNELVVNYVYKFFLKNRSMNKPISLNDILSNYTGTYDISEACIVTKIKSKILEHGFVVADDRNKDFLLYSHQLAGKLILRDSHEKLKIYRGPEKKAVRLR